MASDDDLLAEGAAVPVEGWDFSWFDGRATEERPSWGYSRMLPDRIARATAVLDVQTGGGEVFAEALDRAAGVAARGAAGLAVGGVAGRAVGGAAGHAIGRPDVVVATEAWPPNAALARRRLGNVVGTDGLPFADGTFDLVVSRHPIATDWPEIARILRPGGTYLSQQVGAGSMHELTTALLGPRPIGDDRDPRRHAALAEAAGLTIVDLRSERLRTEFYDLAAVVAYLRKVIWIVPGFTVEAFRERLRTLPIPFVAHAQRFLIEAHKEES